MALNYPGPYELRLYYSAAVGTQVLQHVARYNIRINGITSPGDEFGDLQVIRRSGPDLTASGTLAAVTTDWVTLIKPKFPTTVNFDFAELWLYAPDSFEADFVSTFPLDVPGTAGGSLQPAGQEIWTFRTIEGGLMKLSFMETNVVPGASRSAGTAVGGDAAIRDFVIGANNWILARDTSYPFSAIKIHPGQNEAVFKKRYRAL